MAIRKTIKEYVLGDKHNKPKGTGFNHIQSALDRFGNPKDGYFTPDTTF